MDLRPFGKFTEVLRKSRFRSCQRTSRFTWSGEQWGRLSKDLPSAVLKDEFATEQKPPFFPQTRLQAHRFNDLRSTVQAAERLWKGRRKARESGLLTQLLFLPTQLPTLHSVLRLEFISTQRQCNPDVLQKKSRPTSRPCTETYAPTPLRRCNELRGALSQDCQRCIS